MKKSARLASAGAFALLWATGACGETLPAMSFLQAQAVSPSQAQAYYGTGTTHSSSYVGVSGFEGRPPEIVEGARALRGSPDNIYEYVHNQITTEFAFGVRKGALGAMIDRSGTPFDQNLLFVELVRQAGYTARYRIGPVTMTGEAFASWTGISDAKAACKLLAGGGVPASVNGTTDASCATSGAISSVTLLHVWSEVQIGGAWYAFDPSFKARAATSLRDVKTDMGFTTGAAASTAGSTVSSGSDTSSGSAYIKSINATGLEAYLQARSTQLQAVLTAQAAGRDLDDVVGLPQIVQEYAPTGGWRNATPAGYSTGSAETITGDIPDQYRTTLQVTVTQAATVPVTLLDRVLYTDDFYGRRFGLNTNFDSTSVKVPTDYCHQTVSLVVDDVALQTYTEDKDTTKQGACGSRPSGYVTLAINHPYAASSGTFGDQSVTKDALFTVPLTIVAGFGNVSSALASKWSGEAEDKRTLPSWVAPPPNDCDPSYVCYQGDQPLQVEQRHGIAASWLAQVTRMFALQGAVGDARIDHQHSLGLIAWRHGLTVIQNHPENSSLPYDFQVADQFTSINIDTTLAVSGAGSDQSRVPALSRSVAASAAALEGSMLEQVEGMPDTSSTATRFAWANTPDDEDPCAAGQRRFYDFSGSTQAGRISSAIVYEGATDGCSSSPPFNFSLSTNLKTELNYDLQLFVDAGFSITAPGEAMLGPGARFGPISGEQNCVILWLFNSKWCTSNYDPTRQRGGAFVATRRDADGQVLQVAHVITGYDGMSKGGGGNEPELAGVFDPGRAADRLKDRLVDRSSVMGVDLKTGVMTYSTPVLASTGNGEEPFAVQNRKTYKAGPTACFFGYCGGPPQNSWTNDETPWFTVSASGLEAMGQTRPEAAAQSLAAFAVQQDIFAQSGLSDLSRDVYATLAADWWRRQFVGNVATLTYGFKGAQYVKLADGTWRAPVGSPGVLTQTGARAKVRDVCHSEWPGTIRKTISTSRRWDEMSMSFSLRHADGETVTMSPWKVNYDTEMECANAYGFSVVRRTWPSGVYIDYSTRKTSLGRSLIATTDYTFDSAGDAWKDANGGWWRVEYAPVVARSATARPIPYKQIVRTYEPGSTVPTAAYTYDSLGRVMAAQDGVGYQTGQSHTFYIGEGGRGERVNPLGGGYVVYYDQRGRSVRHIDELGRTVKSTYDGLGRVASRTYPEGDIDQFKYDGSDNVIQLDKTAKSGSSLAAISVTAGYDATWNKPSWVKDARGNQTDFAYVASGNGVGEVSTATQPAVSGVRPVWSFEYNAYGQRTKVTDPTGVVTTTAYDALGNPTSSTLDPTGVAATSCKSFDATGNVVSETDPRAGVCP